MRNALLKDRKFLIWNATSNTLMKIKTSKFRSAHSSCCTSSDTFQCLCLICRCLKKCVSGDNLWYFGTIFLRKICWLNCSINTQLFSTVFTWSWYISVLTAYSWIKLFSKLTLVSSHHSIILKLTVAHSTITFKNNFHTITRPFWSLSVAHSTII